MVLDLSAFYDSSALGGRHDVRGRLAARDDRRARTPRRTRAGEPPPKFINVFDEAWRALSVLGVGEWLQDAFKKSRSYGVQNIVVMHRLSDLAAAGAAGSREVALAEGLLHDAQTRVVYRQVEDEVPRTRELLGLTSLEAELLPELWTRRGAVEGRGRAASSFSTASASSRLAIVDTDGRMRAGAT